jgi:anti-anti-sigma factor
MAIKCDEYDRVGVIAIQGDFAGEQVAPVRQAVAAWQEAGAVSRLVLDLEKTTFLDSQALETITWAKRRFETGGGRVVLASVGETCRKVLEITRLERRIESFPDVPAALRAIEGG